MSANQAAGKRVRARNRLSTVKVAKARQAGLYENGAGLRLVVTEHGTKRWVVRVTIGGRRVERGLGVWPTVSLDDARQAAEHFRRAAMNGLDARTERNRSVSRNAVSFRDAFDAFLEIRRQHLRNGKHVAQWTSTMEAYVLPSQLS